MAAGSLEEMLQEYSGHPLSRAPILSRVKRQAPTSDGYDEFMLAVDPIEEITDQNHIGGARSTIRLGARAFLRPDDRVLDLGCGLGGPARLVADVFGCTVHGIDANAERIADAVALTDLVGLTPKVTFSCGNFLTEPFNREYTVVWAQNAWIHVGEPRELARVAKAALLPKGRLAFEDVCLMQPASGLQQGELLDELRAIWHCELSRPDDWVDALQAEGFVVRSTEDERATFRGYFERLVQLASRGGALYKPREVRGWQCALALAKAEVLSYWRVVGMQG